MSAMSPFRRSALILLSSILLLMIGACAIQLRPTEETNSTSPTVPQEPDPASAKLAQCRTVTADQTSTLDECRWIWMENRRRFLGQRSSGPAESSIGSSPSIPTPQDK
jgi:conjugative transfer region protein TrbK